MVNIRFERIANRAANPTLAADGLGHVCALRPELKALSMYCISGLVRAQTKKCGVPRPPFCGPLDESDLSDELGLDPHELSHLLGRETTAPASPFGVRQILERGMIGP